MLDRAEIVGGSNDALGKEKAGGEVAVGARRAHDDGKRPAVQANLERFLRGGAVEIGCALPLAHAGDADRSERVRHTTNTTAGFATST